MAAGYTQALVLKNDGTVAGWRNNNYGQTTPPAGLADVTAIAAGGHHSLALKSDGTMVGWGSDIFSVATVPAGLVNVKSIAGSTYGSVAARDAARDFGSQAVGMGTPPMTFRIKSTGADPLVVTSVSVTGRDISDFTVSQVAVNSRLAPLSDAITFTVTFAPTERGPRRAKLRILNTDKDEAATEIQLTGTGLTPEIAVYKGDSTDGADERFDGVAAPVVFPDAMTGVTSAVQVFTIKNKGVDTLTGLTVSTGGSSDFIASNPVATSLAPNTTTSFSVSFHPSGSGLRTAVISIASDDADENPFEINVAGTGLPGLTALEAWRQQHFGSPANSGDGADLFDFDQDGLTNLAEFAFGLHPRQPNSVLSPAGALPEWQYQSGVYSCSFPTPAGVEGITYRAEWSSTLQPGGWQPVTDTGTGGAHLFSVPAAGRARLYLRLTVEGP